MEVCIDDQWHEARFAIVANNPQLPRNINLSVTIADSTSVTIKWSGQQSIPSDNNTIKGYDLSCTTLLLSDDKQIHEVRIFNISTSTTRVQVSGLLPGTAYQCCVNAHIQTNTPLDLISSNCVTTSTINDTVTDSGFVSREPDFNTFSTTPTEREIISTRTEIVSNHHDCSAIGLGIGLGVVCLLLMGSVVINIIFLTMCLKNNATKSIFKTSSSCTNE